MNKTLCEIEVDAVVANPHQPRKHFQIEDLEELAASIQQVGIIHPPVVRQGKELGTYELLSGERRLRAAKLAGLKRIPVIVETCSVAHSAEAALIENIQRVDLNPLEIAASIRQLMVTFDLTQEMVAKKVGKKRSTVANYLRLLQSPKELKDHLLKGSISMGHVKVLLSVEPESVQLNLLRRIVKEGLSVRQMEKMLKGKGTKVKPRDVHLEDLQEKLQNHFGTKVTCTKGSISLSYYTLDDLERILQLIGIECGM
ncbi:MAG: ParB/RepB/Spo0J family partition protein [Chlamydiia bacterium]|nr:ParB/RepB/Spo0J family partition protein [Chlamydiia bacterium]